MRMQVPYRDERQAPGLPSVENNGEFSKPRATGSDGRGYQLLGRPRRNEPFDPPLLTPLCVIFVSLATVYFLLCCFRYFDLRSGVGLGSRRLAEGSSAKGAACQSESDDEEENTSELGVYGGPSGKGAARDERGRERGQKGLEEGAVPPPRFVASGGAGVASDNGQGLGARPKTKSWDTATEGGWGVRRMPQEAAEELLLALSWIEKTATACRRSLPFLSATNGRKLLKSLASLAAVELSAFSICPVEYEPERQRVAGAYIRLLEENVGALAGNSNPELQQTRRKLLGILKVMQKLKTPRRLLRPFEPRPYRLKMVSQLKLFSASNMHMLEAMERLSALSTKRLSNKEILMELRVISAIFDCRKKQVMRDSTLRWWLITCQDEAGKRAIVTPSDIRQGNQWGIFGSLNEMANEIHEAVERVRGFAGLQRFPELPPTPEPPARADSTSLSPQQMAPLTTPVVPQQIGPHDPGWSRSHPFSSHGTPAAPQQRGPFGSRWPQTHFHPFGSRMPSPAPVWPPTPAVPRLPFQYPDDASRPSAPLDRGPYTSQYAMGYDAAPHSAAQAIMHAASQAQATLDQEEDVFSQRGKLEDDESLDPELQQLLEKGLSWDDIPDTEQDD